MDDVSSITNFVDKYKQAHTVYARMVVQDLAKKALSDDDYVTFIDFAIAHLTLINSELETQSARHVLATVAPC